MKRILVVDESAVVRESLALILGREFAVSKRPLRPMAYLNPVRLQRSTC